MRIQVFSTDCLSKKANKLGRSYKNQAPCDSRCGSIKITLYPLHKRYQVPLANITQPCAVNGDALRWAKYSRAEHQTNKQQSNETNQNKHTNKQTKQNKTKQNKTNKQTQTPITQHQNRVLYLEIVIVWLYFKRKEIILVTKLTWYWNSSLIRQCIGSPYL